MGIKQIAEGLMIAVILAACKKGPPPPAAPADAGGEVKAAAPEMADCEKADCPSLYPVPGAAGLVVDGSWLLDPASGGFKRLPGGDDTAFSPDGKMIAVRQGWELTLGPLWGPLQAGKVEIPLVLPLSPSGDTTKDGVLYYTVMAWISPGEVLVVEQAPYAEYSLDCRVYDIKGGQWSKPAGGCPQGEMMTIYDLEPGPGGLLAIYSSGEGHPDVTVATYSSGGGQNNFGVPAFDLYPFGPLEVFFSDDASEVFFVTSCLLFEAERPCMGTDGTPRDSIYPLRLYQWLSGEQSFKLLRTDVPFGGVVLSGGGLLAWPLPGKVCIGDPADGAKTRCHAVPAEETGEGAGP